MAQNVHAGRNLLKKLHTLLIYLEYIKYSFTISTIIYRILIMYWALGRVRWNKEQSSHDFCLCDAYSVVKKTEV